MMQPILTVNNLATQISTSRGLVHAIRDLSFKAYKGQIIGIVGESGCGKSAFLRSVMRLHDERHCRYSGSINFCGEELLSLPKRKMKALRGSKMSMIFQDPSATFNPIYKVGVQVGEHLRQKQGLKRSAARKQVCELFDSLDVRPAQKRYDQYPFEYSGGLLQRAMIASAVICKPDILFADEPTTALDVTIQAQILKLLLELRDKNNMTIVIVTHDFGVIAEICDYVYVIYAGRIVEHAPIHALFNMPAHPYTRALLQSRLTSASRRDNLFYIPGLPPAPFAEAPECSFADRCQYCLDDCRNNRPKLCAIENKHFAACSNQNGLWHGQTAEAI
ncbi:MAG: ABC transporter ATP-binding protein [Coriobacteriales bacterium]|nr:ABC transporter ATP-binding protein [Coriobacteriales bacterium]